MEEDLLVLIEDISIIKNEDEFYSIFSELPKYRQEKIQALTFENDRLLSLLAGKLIHEGFAKFGFPSLDEKIIVDKNSHPYVPGNQIYFSLSHSGTKAMVVISKKPCGCDIQFMKGDSESIADRFFNESESIEIKNSDNPVITFYKYWGLKESYMKANGQGLSFGLKNALVKDCKIDDSEYISNSYIVDNDYMAAYVYKK